MDNPLQPITLDRLFRVTNKVEVLGKTFTVRSLTDLERNLRFRLATAARSRYAAKLRDPNSDETLATYGAPEDMTDQEMRDVILMFRPRDAAREAQKIEFSFVPFPDDATPEEMDEVNRQREESVAKTNERRATFIKQYLEEAEKDLKERDRPYLTGEYKRLMRESVLTAVYGEEADVQTIFMSLDGQMTLEDVRGLAPQARNVLSKAVMEVDNIDPLHLNGPRLTESFPAPSA